MHADFEASEGLSRENRARSNARFRARTHKPACYVGRGAGYAPFSLFPSPQRGDGAPGSALHQRPMPPRLPLRPLPRSWGRGADSVERLPSCETKGGALDTARPQKREAPRQRDRQRCPCHATGGGGGSGRSRESPKRGRASGKVRAQSHLRTAIRDRLRGSGGALEKG